MSSWRVVVVGLLAGLLAGVFGVGGGILIVPGLMFVLVMEQRRAHGTSLAAVLPIAMAGLVPYIVAGNVQWVKAAALTAGSVVGAVYGVKVLATINKRTLAFGFAALMVLSAARLVWAPAAGSSRSVEWWGVIVLVAIGAFAGWIAGLLGVGGGIVIVPALMVIFGVPPVLAKGTSLAVIVPTSIIGTWRNRKTRNLDVKVAALVGIAGVASAALGGWLAGRLADTASSYLFAVLLAAVAVRLVRSAQRSAR
ncbi:MAG: sulfite exporter TauE/SafE family protein [Ilumatobacteraceae bacterium]